MQKEDKYPTQRKYRDTHKEKVSGYKKLYREKHSEEIKKYAKEHKEANPEYYRNYMLVYRFGITLEDYNNMFNIQKGCCAVCGKHQSELNRILAVDHDHDTGKVRGLLCMSCNTSIGKLGDSIESIEKVLSYLKKDYWERS